MPVTQKQPVMTEQTNAKKDEHAVQDGAESLIIDELNADSTVPEIVQWIRDGIEEERTGSDITRVVMDLPPVRRIPGNKNLDAIQQILNEYAIKLPLEVVNAITHGQSDEFTFSAPSREKYLRPRTVLINTAPEVSTLMISGEEPVDGLPGYTEAHYDFTVKSGKIFSDGSIDFREINMFPQASEGKLLLRIFAPTEGVAGTDVYGWRIVPVPGEPVRIAFGDNITTSKNYDEEEKRDYLDVIAAKPGIIVTDFGGNPPRVENIQEISIQNRIELEDIDFSTGNISGDGGELRCTADVAVKGDVRGRFAVLIEGMLEVKGTVEGEVVDASGEVIAHLIRSCIRSGRFIESVAATHAKLTAAEYIKITREFTHCHLRSPEVVFEGSGGQPVLCGSARIYTEQFRLENGEIRNCIEIILGEKLIKQLQDLDKSNQRLEALIASEETHLKTRAQTFAKKLQLTHSLLPGNLKKVVLGLKKFGSAILSETITLEDASEKITKLQNSLGPEFNVILDQLKRMIRIQATRQEKLAKQEELIKQREALIEELQKMRVYIRGKLTPKGQVIIKCADSALEFQGEVVNPVQLDILIGYDPLEGKLIDLKERQDQEESNI